MTIIGLAVALAVSFNFIPATEEGQVETMLDTLINAILHKDVLAIVLAGSSVWGYVSGRIKLKTAAHESAAAAATAINNALLAPPPVALPVAVAVPASPPPLLSPADPFKV